MNDETAERIEMKIAYLERATNDLSDVIYRQQREIEALQLRLAALTSRLEEGFQELRATRPEPDPASERPPHY